jgi:UDP-N-acetylmuramoyl-tripeptide--D-alanyl-D-alanine ligase
MDPISLGELAPAVGGRRVPAPSQANAGRRGAAAPPSCPSIAGVSTDSRAIGPGELFIPLRGERFDGHDFIPSVAGAAAAALVAEPRLDEVLGRLTAAPPSFELIAVDDPLLALERLARWQRGRLRATVIGVTGSFGKTTVKEFCGQMLARCFETVRARKSFNNRIGVAATILSACESTRCLVVEMGTNAPGEIAELTWLARPDLAVLTAIGCAHLEGLGSLDGVVRAKAEIFEGLRAGGTAVLPAVVDGEAVFERAIRARRGRTRRFGWEGRSAAADECLIRSCEPWSRRGGGGLAAGFRFALSGAGGFELGVPGRHNVENAAAAVAVGRELGMDWDSLRDAVRGLELPPLRLSLEEVAGVTVIDDTYNANPGSVRAALRAVEDIPLAPGGRWFLVLGDLLELGVDSPGLHCELGEEIGRRGLFEALWTLGEEARQAAHGARRFGLDGESLGRDEGEALVAAVCGRLKPGDGVLFKASRGIALDRAAAALRQRLRERDAPALGGGPSRPEEASFALHRA